MHPPATTPREVFAAAYVASGGPDDLPVEQAAARWERKAATLSPGERERYIAAGFAQTHTPEPKSETINGVNYHVLGGDYDRRWHDGRRRAHAAYKQWLFWRFAPGSNAVSQPHGRTAPRTRGAGRPAARRRRTSTTRDDGSGSDSDGPGKAGPDHDGGEVA